MTMIERVARAIYACRCRTANVSPDWDGMSVADRAQIKLEARVAIEAMREPTEEMLLAGWVRADAEWIGGARDLPQPEIARLWDALIDAALSAKSGPEGSMGHE